MPKKAAASKKAAAPKKAIAKASKNATSATAKATAKALSVAGSTANAGLIKVDGHLLDTHLAGAGDAAVHEDYAFLGNQVDIKPGNTFSIVLAASIVPVVSDPLRDTTPAGANSNKFYRGQVVVTSAGAFAWTRWGRVGEAGQNNLNGPLSLDAAIKEFEAKFKSIFSVQYVGTTHSVYLCVALMHQSYLE